MATVRRFALLACLLILAGCQTGGGPVTPTPTPSGAPSVSATNGSEGITAIYGPQEGFRANGTAEVVTIGSESERDFTGHVEVTVWNDASRTRSIDVELEYLPTNRTLYHREGIPANETITFDVRRSGRYVVTVMTNATTHSLSLGWDTFDCNERWFSVRVAPDGRTESSGSTTALGCPTPGA